MTTSSKRQAYEVTTQSPGLTDESLDEARSLIGTWLRREHFRWNDTVAADSVRQFCHGLSDTNPLWLDAEHAAGSRFGGLVAPPTYLYSVDRGHVAPRLRGVQWIYAGAKWEFFQPLTMGLKLDSRARLIDARWIAGRKARRMILQEGEVEYHDSDGTLVARATTRIFRIPRARADGGLSYSRREPHHYTPADIERIEDAIDAEQVRGAVPRLWADVRVGDTLPAVVKGPLNMSDMIMFYAGVGCFYLAHEMAWLWRRRHPADAYADPKTGTQDHPARGHTEEFMAGEVGMPGPYDSGLQRVCWLGQVCTNWMGDDGDLVDLDVRLRRPNVFGDTQFCAGVVTGKRDGGLVDIELTATNQNGEIGSEATATVRLPGAPAGR
ncbi:MAG TPA: MaoC family dehydratase N-terminal domain-containing protein [Pseudonocardiaceae bacterium]|nr:MaoC family dehydratase N-terminal domain-containing protein [Pseudonocardiaceae bacterium]